MIRLGEFTSSAGLVLPWKVDCDMIKDGDIKTYAAMIATKFHFQKVYFVPTGGKRLADALQEYIKPDGKVLIVDDVLTTGKSMEEARNALLEKGLKADDIEGVVLVSRTSIIHDWIYPIFTLNIPFQK